MNVFKVVNSIVLIGLLFQLVSCDKQFLEKKPDSIMVIPETLDDVQKLLDNTDLLNETPGLGQLACDDWYFYTDEAWQTTSFSRERNAYLWAEDVYQGEANVEDWNTPYQQVLYANVAIKSLDAISTQGHGGKWTDLRAHALFLRAYAFFNLASIFCEAYDSQISTSQLGIPLRLNSEIDHLEKRSTLEETYAQIISDLMDARVLSQIKIQETNKNRVSQSAIFALLSRVYLNMRYYAKAEAYSDSCLQLYNRTIDYNSISISSTSPFSINNIETIYHSTMVNSYSTLAISSVIVNTVIDTTLYDSYHQNDLRKQIYFRISSIGTMIIKRGYQGTMGTPFTGLAVDEVLLTKAECLARRDKMTEAMDLLNSLLSKRFKTGSFVPLTPTTAQEALITILQERRKELVFRGTRWLDLKRLNKEKYTTLLRRIVNGQIYTLPPNGSHYVFPIPDDEISISGIEQNPR